MALGSLVKAYWIPQDKQHVNHLVPLPWNTQLLNGNKDCSDIVFLQETLAGLYISIIQKGQSLNRDWGLISSDSFQFRKRARGP